MEYRVWISTDMESLIKAYTSDIPVFESYAFFENVDQEGLTLLLKFMQHQGCAVAIMPALPKKEE